RTRPVRVSGADTAGTPTAYGHPPSFSVSDRGGPVTWTTLDRIRQGQPPRPTSGRAGQAMEEFRGQRGSASGATVQRARRRGGHGAARLDERDEAATRRRAVPRGRRRRQALRDHRRQGETPIGRTPV